MRNVKLFWLVLIGIALFSGCEINEKIADSQSTTDSTISDDQFTPAASSYNNPYEGYDHILNFVDPNFYSDPEHTYFQDSCLQELVSGLPKGLNLKDAENAYSYAKELEDLLAPYLKEATYTIDGLICSNGWELCYVDSFDGGWCAWYWEVVDTSGFKDKTEKELFDIRYGLHDSSVIVLFSDDGHIINILDGMSMEPMNTG